MAETLKLTMQQALSRAELAVKKEDVDFARQLYAAILQKHPNHLLAKKRLRKLERGSQPNQARPTSQTDPSPTQMNTLLSLYNSGEMSKTEQACKKVLALFPKASTVYTILGATLLRQGKTEQALKVYDQAIQLKPDYAEAYNNRGIALQKLGQLEEAIKNYDKAIQLEPDFTEVYNNRGNALIELGQLEKAIRNYDRAIQLKHDYMDVHYNRGNALKELGRLKEALKSYDQAIQLKPDFAQAYYSRGIVLKDLGQLKAGLESYDRAIRFKPDYVEAYMNRGKAHKELGQLEEAIKNLDQAIQLKPDLAEAYHNRGLALQELGQLEEAIKNYDRAIQLQPDFAQTYDNRGLALQDLGQLEEALKSYDRAIQLQPDYAQAFCNRGNTLQELDQPEEAIKNYDRALQLKPDYTNAHYNRGTALQKLDLLEEAVKSYNRAIQFKPDFVKAYNNCGNVLKRLGQLEDAIICFEKALQISPNFYSARYNRSHVRLLEGKLEQGWPEYEFRFKALKKRKPTFQQGAEWQGEPLENKKVFVYPEQGFGDIIQFIRYLPMIKELGGKVIFQVTKPLLRLMETFQGYDQLWSEQHNLDASSKNNFDYHVPLLSLPRLFNTTLENIPSASPYLSADNKLIRMWQKRIASKKLFKVGIVWAASDEFKANRLRSIPLSNFKVLNDIKGVKLFSLQKDKPAKWTDIDPGEVVDIDLGVEILDFADTAAIIENLDLVVSVDTSVAHLAGALGKEVWTLLPFSPDWRWMLNRSDSPWYPSMRLFRPPSVYDWKSVLQEVRKALVQR